jgi:ferredoxin--NADP+ reductase
MTEAPLRVAIVGSGPSGAFLAMRLLEHEGRRVEIDLVDRRATPWGLVRGGVAPDHERIKGVTRRFEAALDDERCRFVGNVTVGEDVEHAELQRWYHAVVYATGCPDARRLGLPGEDLRGVHPATDFVSWYNGDPSFADRAFDLSGERAVVVGNGNVALDCARMLLLPPEQLATTDVADHALEALSGSRIREVVVLGRRGAEHAAFTTPELKALATAFQLDVPRGEATIPMAFNTTQPGHRAVRNMQLLRRTMRAQPTGRDRRVTLRFLVSPTELVGDDRGRVRSVRLVRNELHRGPHQAILARPTDEELEPIDASLVLGAIGYRGRPIPGVPFDERRGLVPNMAGRVTGDPGQAARTYVAGWIKRGPSGVIGTNKRCAYDTATLLAQDATSGRLDHDGILPADEVLARLRERGARLVDRAGWRAIDDAETAAGEASGRPRVKLTATDDLLAAAGA